MIAHLLLSLALLLTAAKLGGVLAVRLGQPAVLGELVAGIALGALPALGLHGAAGLAHDPVLEALAELGVILLLFEVGLSTRLAELVKVGASAFLVACIGVVAPMALGYGVGAWLLPGASPLAHLFLGAALSATSVGITARVLRDMGRIGSPAGQIILGAAVIDDVLGLLVLAVMVGLAGGGGDGAGTWTVLALVGAKAVGFLGAALVAGRWAAPRLFAVAARLRAQGVLFTLALAVCLALSWAASAVELAPIVGAFAAGLVLEGVPFAELSGGEERLEERLTPLAAVLVPLFFVRMGLAVDLGALGTGSLALAGALSVAAIVGKQACALAVVTPGVDRLAVGLGMIPRGEVGLIFANIGLSLTAGGRPLLGPGAFAAIVAMVLVTTLVTPPLLRWRMGSAPAAAAVRPGPGVRAA
ncbi:cation:proton antiporter [Anaeromyxobacter dehalogenans]|uniref:Sodium/proton antiporter NhaS3, CPA2 family n=1 Tax=Anaeromyxobacter dehalogenans (strain 2CP-C) TaxID=290397 RepID=Q2IFS6_ANADE|nr:cation:proton antiporter [Anaeromyxobacter dehalogenans]ABC83434.1 sodium/proton antiporter NhaS3, CPA2 family [Anaeromyxobacter dehalogenans 2CP-C]